MSYGQKSNADLLLLYGFALDRNPHNTVSLDFQLDPNDDLYDDKMAFVDKAGLPSRIFFPVGDDKSVSQSDTLRCSCVYAMYLTQTEGWGGCSSD